MSFSIESIRLEDKYLIRAYVSLKFDEECDNCSIMFKCGEDLMDVLSTSFGEILNENNINITENSEIEADLEYCGLSDKIECLIGYYKDKELINYKTFFADFENKQIKNAQISAPIITTQSKSFKDRFQDFDRLCQNRSSPWEFTISCPDDIIISPISKGKSSIMVCFGEISQEVLASDHVFSVYPDMSVLNMPKEVIKIKYPQYSLRCNLGLFELVKPDFVSVDNLYYKVRISNILPLSEFSSKQ